MSDDLNSNSLIEDADHQRELVARVTDRPQIGDLLAYPTIRIPSHELPWIGHVAIVVGVDCAAELDLSRLDWVLLDVVQCCGAAGRRPGIHREHGGALERARHDVAQARASQRAAANGRAASRRR